MARRRLLLQALCSLPLVAVLRPGPTAATDAQVDVRRFGARGDGRHDDTTAMQAAVDALPGSGGTVIVPAGSYLIDPVRSVHLRSAMRLQLAAGATLVSRPTDAPRSCLLLVQDVDDVEISGGHIVGDRDRHLGSGGEWGHGIQVRGARGVVIRDLRVSRCWGDGISIGAVDRRIHGGRAQPSRDVLVQRVASTGNRRQGLTIGRAVGVRVLDCEFSDTSGTAPEAGIDIEPDAPSEASAVEIARCRVRGNRGPGIQVWRRTRDVTIRDCTIEDNGNVGVLAAGTVDATISGNRIRGNGRAGVAVRSGSRRITIRGNRFAGNAARRGGAVAWTLSQIDGRRRALDVAADSVDVRIAADNRYD